MSWSDELQQASFRGLPFGVHGGEGRFGRRVVPHEYPGRDKPYVEDLGRATRRIRLVGFLVENSVVYGGGSVIAQREAMIAAAETAGPGILVHPTLGQLTVSIPDGGLAVSERSDAGRYFELNFTFIESGDRVFPSITQASGSLLSDLANALGVSAALDFVNDMTASINLGLGIVNGVISVGKSVVGAVVGVAADFAVIAGQISRDATSLANLGSLLTGNFGRYSNANVSSAFANGQSTSGVGPWTIASLTAQGAEQRAAVDSASAAFNQAAAGIDAASVSTFAATAQASVATLAGAIGNPGDAINRLGKLATYSPTPIVGGGQVAAAMLVAQQATSAIVRRAAIAAIAQAVAAYAPSSYDDAANLMDTVTGYIDDEILIAGDAGDDSSYSALRTLRQCVVQTLTRNGATLAPLKAFQFRSPLPSLVLAQRIYQDASRSDELVSEANPVHPGFMPTSFRALAT